MISTLAKIVALNALVLVNQPSPLLQKDGGNPFPHSYSLTDDHSKFPLSTLRSLERDASKGFGTDDLAHRAMFIGEDDREKLADDTVATDYPFVGAWFIRKRPGRAMEFAGNATAVHPRVAVLTSHQISTPDAPNNSIFSKAGLLKNAAHSIWIWFAGCSKPVRVDRMSEVGWFLGQENSPINDYSVAVLSDSCLTPEEVAEPVSLEAVRYSSLSGIRLEMVSRVPAHSFKIPGTDYRTFWGRDVFIYLKSKGKITQPFNDDLTSIGILMHDLDADHGHSGSGVLLADGEGRKRFIGVLSGSMVGRDPVTLKTDFTNSVAYAGALQRAVEAAIAEVDKN